MNLTAVRLGGRPDLPLLVLGPALGTTAQTLWADTAARLAPDFQVVGWDLPGHGTNTLVPEHPVEVADLAAAVLDLVDDMASGLEVPTFHYAGVGAGGAVGLQLLLDAPARVASAVLVSTRAAPGDNDWAGRAATVREGGTAACLDDAARRWFAPTFEAREPRRCAALLDALRGTDPEGYAVVCEALARFDVRDRLGEVAAPVVTVAGGHDVPAAATGPREIADGVRHGRAVVLDGVARLVPAEAPEAFARLVRDQVLGPSRDTMTVAEVRKAGMAVRREVLGAAYVDRAMAGATEVTRDFQELITEYAWGGIWSRPGLDRRSRSMIAVTALVARGHHEELAMHLRAARTNGLTVEEITEVLMQTAVYCGVPEANIAFRIAQQVFAEER
nr:4-carboxymuconolactone decarboxylase [Nocardioides pantholopis]